MVRLADGDRGAFPMLVDDLWPVLLAFAQRGVGQHADAEDIAQEVFFRICARIADFDRSRDAVSWAFGIAGYEILTHRRRLGRRREVHDETEIARVHDGAPSQEEALMRLEIMEAFTLVVGTLSDEDRRALGLLENGGDDGVSGPALRKRRQRALDRLRDLWRSVHGEP